MRPILCPLPGLSTRVPGHRTITTPKKTVLAALFAAQLVVLPACSIVQGAKRGGMAEASHASAGTVAKITSDPDYASLTAVERATLWAKYHDRSPGDPAVIEAFSKSLREIGSIDRALSITAAASGKFATHQGVRLEYAKALIADGRAFEAIRPLEQALEATRHRDWRILSVYGVALDSIEEHERARIFYEKALELSPQNPKILNNLGLSLALAGERAAAETTLRGAAQKQDATAQIRQNLSLVLAIDGQLEEAAGLARSDLPPEQAEKNILYFNKLHENQDYWSTPPNGSTADVPDFDAAIRAGEGRSAPERTAPEPGTPVPGTLVPASQSIVSQAPQKTAAPASTPGLPPSSGNGPSAPVARSAAAAEKASRTGAYDSGTLNRRPTAPRGP